ncbi:MAG: hypothetical protein K0T99_04500 [Alphaproteobacteria bacterium]|nr:hypothetical protein [Alphaproteobacteria bacterium]
MSKQERQDYSKQAETWLQTLSKGADYAILTQALVSELGALFGDASHIHEVILSGILRGIEEEFADIDVRLSKGKASSIEKEVEKTLAEKEGFVKSEKEHFQQAYSAKKAKIKNERSMLKEKDIPQLILEYETMHFNVFNHVTRKHLSNPDIPEEDKKNIRKFSEIIDQIRIVAQTTTAGSLAHISQLSLNIGKNIAKNAHHIIPEHLLKQVDDKIQYGRVIKYLIDTYSKAMTKGASSLLTLPNQVNELGKFITAGAYEGLKTTQQKEKSVPLTQKKKLNPNAMRRKEEKKAAQAQKRETIARYGTDAPSTLQQIKYMSGYEEWQRAYSMVKRAYKKTDKIVGERMDELLKKIPAKAGAQEELEARRVINQEGYIAKGALSFYDSIRAAATASTLVTNANLYRMGRYIGEVAQSTARRLDSRTEEQKLQKIAETEEFKDIAKAFSATTYNKRQRNKKRKHKKGRGI